MATKFERIEIELLKKYGIPAYEYREKDFEKDQEMIAKIGR